MNLSYLAEPFPTNQVHWRAQSLRRDGSAAMALAYLDARDVMDRLDLVCGPQGWCEEFTETPRGRVICRLGIKVGDEWVFKSDGAGETAVEGEKGGISDAMKRAAVHWGVGRYLYRLSAPWVPCETYENKGKTHWKSWKESPWTHVKAPTAPDEIARDMFRELGADGVDIANFKAANSDKLKMVEVLVPAVYREHIAPRLAA